MAPGRFMLRRDLRSHYRGGELVQVRLEDPEIPVAHDLAVVLIGVHERGRHLANDRRAISPVGDPAHVGSAILQSVDCRYPLGRNQGRSAAVRCPDVTTRPHAADQEEGP